MLWRLRVYDHLGMRKGRGGCAIISVHLVMPIRMFRVFILIVLYHCGNIGRGHNTEWFCIIHSIVIAILTKINFARLAMSVHILNIAHFCPAHHTNIKIFFLSKPCFALPLLTHADKIVLKNKNSVITFVKNKIQDISPVDFLLNVLQTSGFEVDLL